MKPHFLVIGAAKCATTTIRSLLGRHPDVFMVPRESHFFTDDSVYARGFDWYESLFAGAKLGALCGEGCNAYTMKEALPQTFGRLTTYAPKLKLLYAVREPFERIESFWMELRSQHPDYAHYDFNKAVEINRDWLTDPSNYLSQLEPYRRFYGDDAIHVVFYEDFRANPDAVIRGCFEFLGVDPDANVGASSQWLNESEGKALASPILSQLRAISLYRRAVDRLPFTPRDAIARKLFYRKARNRPMWNPETRARVANVLRDDLRKFLVQYGKPADFWNVDRAPDQVTDAESENGCRADNQVQLHSGTSGPANS
jgi:Sulfotransferase domain